MVTDFYYQTFEPSASLRPYVEHLWALKADNSREPQRQILIPNGRPGLVLCLGNPGTRLDSLTQQAFKNENIYFGIATRPYILDQQGLACYIGVQCTPFGLGAFRTQSPLSNEFGSIHDLFGHRLADALIKEVKKADFGESAVRYLDDFLAVHHREIPKKQLNRLLRSVDVIDSKNDLARSLSIAKMLDISPTTLRRLFKTYVGISPEQLIGITRYTLFVKELVQNDPRPQATVAALHGFYDESHAAKDFKKYTGLSRSDFLQAYDGIARLMYV